jgi:hypothetical protein
MSEKRLSPISEELRGGRGLEASDEKVREAQEAERDEQLERLERKSDEEGRHGD